MSLHEYRVSRALDVADPPFYALIMAAMRRADTTNFTKLRAIWPEVWEELDQRYNAPGGVLPGEQDESPAVPGRGVDDPGPGPARTDTERKPYG